MKTISGHCVPVKDILVSKAAKILTKFVSADNGASLVINAYLHRASASFNELKQLHKELGSSHSHKKHKRHITENGNDSGIISLDLPKVKNPAKGKVLMQAMYGVKVETVFICRVFTAAFSGLSNKLSDLNAGVDIVEIEWLVKTVEELRAGVEKLSQGNDLLAKGVDGLFEAAMTSRDTLLSFVRFDKIVNDRSPGRNRDMQHKLDFKDSFRGGLLTDTH
ncbi:Protein BPS1, chloroplastic [Glycine soja]|uniref:Protein BPS1, chloroplastic n=1 Tax=Glycine soja TaxID=3848 RepID=A0A0B2R8D8_GLYSO|nr:Protein BPS1, chloroplastic [Glycine soja]